MLTFLLLGGGVRSNGLPLWTIARLNAAMLLPKAFVRFYITLSFGMNRD
jgi:hypothetical protein